MKRVLILTASAIILISNIGVMISARSNRSDAPGGTIELTERELGLPPLVGDSTAILLHLRWRVPSSPPHNTRSPDWLNVAKLTELGFDCSIAATQPNARDHYEAVLPVLAFLVLEYEGQAWKSAPADPHFKTRLFAVDAGRDPRQLRMKYPDSACYLITRGVIGIQFQDRHVEDRSLLPEPRLRGWIGTILPGQIFVPPPYSKSLQALRRRDGKNDQETGGEPRFAVTVSWGADYEPWIKAVRLLKKGDPESKPVQ